MFDFGSPHINYYNEICILILFCINGFLLVLIGRFREIRGGEGGLVALQFFGYLKRQLELLIFNERSY